MTVSTTTNKIQYTGNGATTAFAFPYIFFATTDLLVTLFDTSANLAVSPAPVLNGAATYDYTVTGTFDADKGEYTSGGTVTFNNAPPANYRITIERVVPQTQSVVLIDNSKFPANTVNGALDRLTVLVQRVAQLVGQAVTVPSSDPSTVSTVLPAASTRASNFLAFDSSGNPIASAGTAGPSPTPVSSFWAPILALTTAALSRTALGAVGVADNNTWTGSNNFVGSTVTVTTQTAGDSSTKPASTAFLQAAILAAMGSGVRQTVAAGPVTTAGLPNFWPSSVSGLTLTTQNLTSTYPFVATAANGWGTNGLPANAVFASTANLNWTAVNGSTVFAAIDAVTGATSTLSLTPVYQWGGTPSTTNGQYTFNIGEMRGYLGNGSTAPQSNLVIVGEITASGGNITSTVMYAYNGRYESAFTATLPGGSTLTSTSHNLGIYPTFPNFIIECLSADAGFSVGDRVALGFLSNGIAGTPIVPTLKATTKTMALATASGGWLMTDGSGSGAGTGLTVAKWKYKFFAWRGWGGA